MQVKYLFSVLILLFSISISSAGKQESEIVSIQKEIKEYETKTEKFREQVNHTEKKAKSDSSAYQEYIKDYKELYNRLQAECDSLNIIATRLRVRQESFKKDEERIKIQRDDYSSLSAGLRANLRLNCDILLDSLQSLLIFNISRQISALKFLGGEITSETIDPVEGLERYYQIAHQIEEKSGQTETWMAPAPLSSLGGDVSWLRLGFVWLACINNDDSAGLFWDSSAKKWQKITNTTHLLRLRKA